MSSAKNQQPVASDSHDKVIMAAGYARQETVSTTLKDRVKTATRYTKAGKDDKNSDWPSNSVDVTYDSKSGETIWCYCRNYKGSYQSDSGSSADALEGVLK